MMRPSLSSLVIGVIALSGCSDSPPSAGNPRTLWLAPNVNETHVKLVESEPPPF
jgi:hypothetical protein